MKTTAKLLRKNAKTKRPRNVSALRNQKPALVPPIQAAPRVDDHAQRINNHRLKLEMIQAAYADSTRGVIEDHESIGKKKAQIRRNMRQFGEALGDWWGEALELLEAGQQVALLQMLPDLKAGVRIN